MLTVSVNFNEDEMASLGHSPDELAREVRTAAAIFWYSQGQLSMERAARVANMGRADFLFELSRRKVPIFDVDPDELKREMANEPPA